MGPITTNLYKQVKGWRTYSVIIPTVFAAIAAFLFLVYGVPFQDLFYAGSIILLISSIIWWHWSMSTMMTMLAIMKDTDDHFDLVAKKLEELRVLNGGKPKLTVIKPVDTLQ